jgi:hypothetical protein
VTVVPLSPKVKVLAVAFVTVFDLIVLAIILKFYGIKVPSPVKSLIVSAPQVVVASPPETNPLAQAVTYLIATNPEPPAAP